MNQKTPLTPREITAEIERFSAAASQYYNRAGLYYDTRFALWAGQTDDGRKDPDELDEDPFPWPYASDTRVRLADAIIKERKRLKKLAFWGRRAHARPFAPNKGALAAAVTPLAQWIFSAADRQNVATELTNLGWSYQDAYGAAVIGTFWRQDVQAVEAEFTMESMLDAALAADDPQAAQTVMLWQDPLKDDLLAAGLAKSFPAATAAEIRKAIADVRAGKTAKLPKPTVTRQRPYFVALRPYIDAFFDPSATDIQDCPLVVWREFVSPAELAGREASEGYSAAWIAEALKHKGESIAIANPPGSHRHLNRHRYTQHQAENIADLIEVLHCYQRTGGPRGTKIVRTVIHASVKDVVAVEVEENFPNNEYPFDVWTHEREERPILESRGIPEICLTWQQELKKTRDYRADRLSIDILPPLVTPRNQAGQVALGPAQQIEARGHGEYSFLTPPPLSPASHAFSAEIVAEVCEYFGRFHPAADPAIVMAARQEMITDAMLDLATVAERAIHLALRYLDDESLEAISGVPGQALRAAATTPGMTLGLEFMFDVRTLNTEFLETYGRMFRDFIQPLDRAGVVDSTQLVETLIASVSPWLAQRGIQSRESAELKAVDDEMIELSKMLNGIEPTPKESDNPQLRLTALENAVGKSPEVQQKLQTSETARLLVESRAKRHRFALDQARNATIGRTGQTPVLQ